MPSLHRAAATAAVQVLHLPGIHRRYTLSQLRALQPRYELRKPGNTRARQLLSNWVSNRPSLQTDWTSHMLLR